MRNNLKILILFVILFTTGCSVDYELKINKDLTIEESFTALETRETLKNSYYNSLDEVVETTKNLTIIDTDKYSIQKYTLDNMMGAKVNRKYNSIDQYIEQVNLYDIFLNQSTYTLSSNIATLKSKTLYEANEEIVNILYKIDAKINIKVPFRVVNHNADYVDEATNTYTWNVKNYIDDNKEIYLSFDINDKKIIIPSTVTLSIIFFAFLFLIYIIFLIRKQINKNNKV